MGTYKAIGELQAPAVTPHVGFLLGQVIPHHAISPLRRWCAADALLCGSLSLYTQLRLLEYSKLTSPP